MGWGLPWRYRGKVIRMRGVTVETGSGWVLDVFLR